MKTFRRLSLVASVGALVLAPTAASASAHPSRHLLPAAGPSVKLTTLGRDPAFAPRPRFSPAGSPSHRAMTPGTSMRTAVTSAYTLISGTAVSGAGRWPNARVGVYAWVGGRWVWQGYASTANSSGNYAFYEPSGYYYEVLGEKTYACSYAGGENLWGNSVVFFANGGKVSAQVTQKTVTYYGSGCPS
jgi:hypothetical protein